ncbi:IclR family transcriptional regulator [Halobium salinum]|uniref:IclR family transcriptional regulator n=1 Tax=Halobium salinum TaxID=1364940 RepID=A0ABD5PIM3_9EURY|nr:IclR family transcriptional regulator [Halobium salinum]
MAHSSSSDTTNIRSVETAFAVVELLREEEITGVGEVATALDLARSTAHNYLTTLRNLGYVVHEDGVYRLSWRFLELGEQIRDTRADYRLLGDYVTNLADRFEERAQFIVEENGEGVYLYRETGNRAVWTDSGVGKRICLHSTAAGKAILAFLPESRVEEIVRRQGLEQVTAHTISDERALIEELRRIRERGFAFNREENLERLNAVGVPVRSADGGVLGALSVSGPSHRLKGNRLEKEVPEYMLGLANEIELNLAYPS